MDNKQQREVLSMDNNIFEIEGFEVSVVETGNQILASYTRGNSKALLACDRELENVKATFFNKDSDRQG
jgi:hypothetical protein